MHNKFIVIMMCGVLGLGVVSTPAPALASTHEIEEATLDQLLTTVFASEDETFHEAFAGTNKAAATRVRKAFLQAKKAFHTARQEIQAIKKGDESPAKELPSFFGSDEEDGEEGEEGDQVEDGHEIIAG